MFGRRGYDLIHSRFVGPGIKANRWSSYVRDMKNLLKPGGWMQMMEYYPNIQSDNGRLSSESSIRRWYEGYVYAMERANRKPRIAQELRPLMEAAGLRDIRGEIRHLPIGGWHPGTNRRFHHCSQLSSFTQFCLSLDPPSWLIPNPYAFPLPERIMVGGN